MSPKASPASQIEKRLRKPHGGTHLLGTLFASSARAAVLRLFMLDPLREYYQRQIESATDLPIRAVQRELERMAKLGLLFRRAEGNRTYYQVDMQFRLFDELRGLVLKTVDPVDRLRGLAAVDDRVRLAFLAGDEDRVLLVLNVDVDLSITAPEGVTLETMTVSDFTTALARNEPQLEDFLVRGVDLFGRRDDVIWRRIEMAGYSVEKGKGVA